MSDYEDLVERLKDIPDERREILLLGLETMVGLSIACPDTWLAGWHRASRKEPRCIPPDPITPEWSSHLDGFDHYNELFHV